MRVVALVSGGKDSCYNMVQCVAAGHEIVALANLQPEVHEEMDSYMYQTVGHNGIELYSEAMGLPLFRQVIKGTSVQTDKDYTPTPDDEVEDLYELLKKVQEEVSVEAVSVGAILSDYQRVRVENVCVRLGLTPLAYLWRRDQSELLQEMIACNINAIVIKVAALGLDPSLHLGQTIDRMQSHLLNMKEKYGLNVCGEGGEYETFTLDCPLFKKAIVIDECETVMHSNDAFAPVGYLSFKSMHLVNKDVPDASQRERLNGISVKSPLDYLTDLNSDDDLEELEAEEGGGGREEMHGGGGDAGKSSAQGLVNGERDSEPKVPRETDPVCTGPTVQVDSKGFCWVGNIVGKGCDPVRAATQAMNVLKDVLAQNGYTMSNVSAVSLYVSDMTDYALVNAEYVKFFGANPPIRVCVEAPLPENTPVFLEALAHKKKCDSDSSSTSSCTCRQNMHVQGISHWAPANIGPYSQAIRVDEILYLAGQIGLVPGNMQLVEGGMKVQCKLALRHMGRIVRAMDPKTQLRDVVQGICYVTHHSYIEEARKEWEKRTNNAIVDYVVVPQLPRGALVEWHIWAHIYNSRFEYEETGCYVKEKVKVTLQRRWNYENNVAAIVCRATVGSEEDVIEEESLAEVVRYALRKLMKGAESNATSFIRVFYRVGRLSPRQMEAVLQEMSEFRFAYSVIPSCGLLHQRTLLSICGARHE